jgi:hypothetical protein
MTVIGRFLTGDAVAMWSLRAAAMNDDLEHGAALAVERVARCTPSPRWPA